MEAENEINWGKYAYLDENILVLNAGELEDKTSGFC
jgi:hypothetical protein